MITATKKTGERLSSADVAAVVDDDVPGPSQPLPNAIDGDDGRPAKTGQIPGPSQRQTTRQSRLNKNSRTMTKRLRQQRLQQLSAVECQPFEIPTRSNWCHGVARCCADPAPVDADAVAAGGGDDYVTKTTVN